MTLGRVFLGFIAAILVAGCMTTPLPKKDFPIQLQADFDAGESEVFDAVVEYVNANQKILLNSDKESGIVSYGDTDSQTKQRVYVNVCIRPSTKSGATVLYLFPIDKTGKSGTGVEQQLLTALRNKFGKG